MIQIGPIFVFTFFFTTLLEFWQWFPKTDNFIVSKWYKSLNDKSKSTILVHFFCISLWQFMFFHAALFFRFTFFKLHHFYVAYFCVVIFLCCAFFRVALFYVLHYFMLHFYTLQCFRSAYLLHFFNAALFACSTRGGGSIFKLKGPRCGFKLSLVSRLGLMG